MKKKRILHISNYYPPHIGGIEYVCQTVVASLLEFEHSVICFSDKQQTISEVYEGIRVVRIGHFAKIASQALSISYLYYLKKEIKEFNPDIIHFHAPNPLISIYLFALIPNSVKLIVHYHAEILTSDFLYSCYQPWEKAFFRRANLIIVTSPKLRDEAIALAPYKKKCQIVENTISIKDLDLRPEEQHLIVELKAKYGNKPIIFTFGRHVPYKGLHHLIAAEKYLHSDCEIIIGGTGPMSKELKNSSHSSRIHFVGKIPNEQLRIYLHAADVFAFPSITKAEAFGVTLIQAMYCGTPPVTFKIPASGVNYVNLDGITGLEVENGNAEKFANAIDLILSDVELHQQFVNAGHKRVIDCFTVEAMIEKITCIYNNLIQ